MYPLVVQRSDAYKINNSCINMLKSGPVKRDHLLQRGTNPRQGIHAIDVAGNRYAIFEAYDGVYKGDETTGLAFTPDGRKMYASFQDCGCEESDNLDCGCLLKFSRVDGKSFDGNTLSLTRRHSK